MIIKSSPFNGFLTQLDADDHKSIAIRLALSSNSSVSAVSTSAFIELHFDKIGNSSSNSWVEWKSLGVPDSYKFVHDLLSQHRPKPLDDIDTMTIVSNTGFILFSIHGTSAIFTPSRGMSSTTGSIWQLSDDGQFMRQCTSTSVITNEEIYSSFNYLYHEKPYLQVSDSRASRNHSTADINTDASIPAAKIPRITRSSEINTIDMTATVPTFHIHSSITHPDEDLNSDFNMEIDNPNDERVPILQHYTVDEGEIHSVSTPIVSSNASDKSPTTTTSSSAASLNLNTSDHISTAEPSSHSSYTDMHTSPPSIPTPMSSSLTLYRGPVDKLIRTSTIIISGFSKSINLTGEIAKGTHAMMNASKIQHLLSPETNRHINPQFPNGLNVCGFYPLELSRPFPFRRYPQSSDEKLLFQQHRLFSTSKYYHHFMAYAVSVSPKDFRAAKNIGAFRGLIANSNLIAVHIEEVHRVVFKSDPKIILFPNVLGTNISDTYDTHILHETVIMVKSLHLNTSAIDTLNKFKLTHGKGYNVYPVQLHFFKG